MRTRFCTVTSIFPSISPSILIVYTALFTRIDGRAYGPKEKTLLSYFNDVKTHLKCGRFIRHMHIDHSLFFYASITDLQANWRTLGLTDMHLSKAGYKALRRS